MHHSQTNYLVILACVLALACLAVSINRCLENFAETEAAANSTNPAEAARISADMRLFTNAGNQYQTTGQLYSRATGEDGRVASTYAPMTPVFKFPPPFQLQLLPVAKNQDLNNIFKLVRIVIIAGYFLACMALIMRIATAMRKKNQSSARISLFCTLAAITATSSYGLQTSVLITNYEITIFCLLTASFFLFKNYPKFAAIVIGYLASAKLYPAFMASLLLTHRDGKALVTFFLSVISFFAIGLLVFGQQENLYYFEKVFPVLLSEKVAPNLNNMSFGGGLFKFSKNLEFAQAAFQVYRFLFLSLTCFLLAKHHKNHTQNSIAVFAFLMVMMLMCLPSFWPSYLILLFPAFCVAIYRVVVCPSIVRTAILLTCIASMAFDMNTWTFLGAPGWLTGSAPPDELGNRIIETARHQSLGMAVLVFACHYPWTVFLYFLEQITFIVPSILWLFTAREIMSPALPHTAPCPNQPISSNPERYRRA